MTFPVGLILCLAVAASAFSDVEVTETIGGLITDQQALEERERIDNETSPQLMNTTIFSNFSSISIGCFSSNMTFIQNTVDDIVIVCNLTYTDIRTPLAVSFDIDLAAVASLNSPFWVYLTPQIGSRVVQLPFTIRRTRMGNSYLKVWVREAKTGGISESFHAWERGDAGLVADYKNWLVNSNDTTSPSVMGFHLKVLRARGIVEAIFRIVVAVLVCLITFVMGCELDAMKIWRHLKKPVGPIIGFACQFVLMPLIAFGLAMLLPIKPEFGFGLLATGCCPGGGGSNVWTLLLHGDLNLSMTMTFISSVAALGMMPLALFIFGRFFLDVGVIHIPYAQIAGQLLYVVIPVILGMLFKWRWPVQGACLLKAVRPLAALFILTIIGFGTYVNLPIYRLLGEYPLLVPVAAGLPLFGYLFSGFVAWLCRRSRPEILTIAIETGIQNIGIAILVMVYSMPQPEGDMGACMPLIVATLTPMPLGIALTCLMIKEGRCCRCCKKTKKLDADGIQEVEQGGSAKVPLNASDAQQDEQNSQGSDEPDGLISPDSKRGRTYSAEHVFTAVLS